MNSLFGYSLLPCWRREVTAPFPVYLKATTDDSEMASIQDLLLPVGDLPPLNKDPRGSSSSPKSASSRETTHFTIEFILDTICPHSYVGLRNLNTAIEIYKEHHPEVTFEVTCSPLVLNPHAARSGKSAGFSPTRRFTSRWNGIPWF